MLSKEQQAQLETIRGVTQNVRAKLTTDYNKDSVTLELFADSEQAKPLMKVLVSQLSKQMALQLSSFFGIKGELVEVGSEQ